MKTLLKFFIAIILFACCIYFDDYLQRGAGMLVGGLIACLGLFIGDRTERREEWRDLFAFMGCAIYFIFFFGVANGIHFIEQENGVVIRSAWYTHIVDKGSRFEKRKLRAYYTDRNEVKEDEFFFLYHEDEDSVSVYNMYGMILKVPSSFSIKHKDFGNGELHYISVDDKLAYDMRGTMIKDGYKPYVADITPDYTNSPL